jgi:serine/threonine protein kinase
VQVGKYLVLSHIGSGGMGAVYRARDQESGREVALKVLPQDLVAGKPVLVERFRREALHGAKLRDENIVSLYEFGEANGTYFLVMELVNGINLQERIDRDGPLDPEEARLILIQVTRALDHANQQGIVHRDIKPANVLLAQQEGRVLAKLADLGLAREVREEEFRVTREGYTVGTVDYMAPEQARDSAAADIRSDIYSLGCTAFHMLAGVPPFSGGSLPERLYKHAEAEAPDVRQYNPDVPPELAGVLRKMLAKAPADRYQTPAELLADLYAGQDAARERQPRGATAVVSSDESTTAEMSTPPPAPGPTEGQVAIPDSGPLRIAAGQFGWARQQLARGNHDYAIELLVGCCRLDPTNMAYHKALRQALDGRTGPGSGRGWLARLRGVATRVQLKLAQRASDHRQILARGAELLARNPADLDIQVVMAAAAEALGLDELNLWLLEQASKQDGSSPEVNRALGRYHEAHRNYERALACWEQVKAAAPVDNEARRKVLDLAAMQTLQRTRQKRKGRRADSDRRRRRS